MEAQARKLAEEWLSWDPDAVTKKEISDLVAASNLAELQKRLGSRITFGTAGLRGPMQAGYACMNQLTVLQASQGLCVYLEAQFPCQKARGVVVGYDGRHNSLVFARITAATFISRGWHVHLFKRMVPTPFVAYGVQLKHAVAGVMVTASHNPKQDNGYKVYWENGAQIISPHDEGITKGINANLAPWQGVAASVCDSSPLCTDPTHEVKKAYYTAIKSTLCWHHHSNGAEPKAKIVYTAMHGVGTHWAKLAFKQFGLPHFVGVQAQLQPDPEFPTVKFPNPEEGKGALALSIQTANEHGASFIIANDPDADRMAMAEKSESGSWKLFTGNETGAILGEWIWRNYRASPGALPASQCAMVNSTVSSKMLAAIAAKEGFHYEETLTGFKWMGNKAHELSQAPHNKKVLFAFEEAIGFMCSDLCRDKDGVRAAAVVGELYTYLRHQQPPTTMAQHLDSLYTKYGYFATQNRYFFCYDPAVLRKIFQEIRADGKYATKCGEFEIVGVRDLTTPGCDRRPEAQRAYSPSLPVSSGTEMITFYFANGGTATLRGSGTEPKLKYYVELSGDRAHVLATLPKLTDAIIATFLQPDKFGLVAPTD